MVTRPTRVDQRRVAGPKDKLYDFASYKSKLPIVPCPPRGYSFASILYAHGLPSVQVRVIWDGGAEATSISDAATSRILRAQQGKPAALCALNGMGRMPVAQRFNGYQNDPGTEVDILGTLRLDTADGETIPGLKVRMVPGQHDDLLVSAPDKDYLGWSRDNHPDFSGRAHEFLYS